MLDRVRPRNAQALMSGENNADERQSTAPADFDHRRTDECWLGTSAQPRYLSEDSHTAASLRARDRHFGEPGGLQLVLGPEEPAVWRERITHGTTENRAPGWIENRRA